MYQTERSVHSLNKSLEIKGQLNQSNHAVCSRITKLLPWLRGDMSFDVKVDIIPTV